MAHSYKILIIEDDKAIVDVVRMILESDGYKFEYAYNGKEGLEKFDSYSPDVTLLDIRMPKMDGIEVLKEIKKRQNDALVIMISGHGNIETAVQTTKLGAYDFISKPFDVERLRITIQNGLKYKSLLSENQQMRMIIEPQIQLIGSGKEMKKLNELISRVSQTSSRVLITGENGTGKKLVARMIHNLSSRADKPFVHVNCATIPKDSIEMELFGVSEGFLSHIPGGRSGKFESANGGTLFLDEVADLSMESQAKLLTALSEDKIEPLGSTNAISVDVRIISSTNHDLKKLIEDGKFREDLYHRLNVLSIHVPPLRLRTEDIEELLDYFSREVCTRNNLPLKTFTGRTIEYLKSLKWPGNVREFKNTVERLIIMSDSDIIDRESITDDSQVYSSELDKIINSEITLRDFQDLSEKIFIEKKLRENHWNISRTAELLDMQRSHLYTKMKQLNIENPDKLNRRH